MINVSRLNKYYNKGRTNEIHVIKDMSIELPEKGMTAFFGRSGCGKTTLLNVIGGLDGYSSGSITIDGENIKKDTDCLRNRYIGYIFQNYNLNREESVFDNVADALKLCGMKDQKAIKERVTAALKNVGMEKYLMRTPDTLSGGQQQRVAIARAIVKNPKIILADEPTGNLDETNTVMIMDLLRKIAEDRLVLLVTHEANLVDYYCDTVIGLSDGRVMDVRKNEVTNGYVKKDKNDIYLGELEKREGEAPGAEIEYFGNDSETPVKLRIVNSNGHIYLQVNTPGVKLIDESSEIHLREGVFETSPENRVKADVDMSALPPMKDGGDATGFGSKFGRLFTFKSSVVSGYLANFSNRKKGKKILQSIMFMFTIVLAIMSAVFGTSIKDIIDIESQYNHNVIYVYTPDEKVYEKIVKICNDKDSGVDSHYISNMYNYSDYSFDFVVDCFESFSAAESSEGITANGAMLDVELAKDKKIKAGQTDFENLKDNDIILTTAVADKILDSSSYSYIDSYDDLIGIRTMNTQIGGKSLRVVAIVESNETAFYISRMGLALYNSEYSGNNVLMRASDLGLSIEQGHTVAFDFSGNLEADTVNISGTSQKVDKIIRMCDNYADWLKAGGYDTSDYYSIASERGISLAEAICEYYSHLSEYIYESGFFHMGWVDYYCANEFGSFAAQCVLGKAPEYYNVMTYRKQHGSYPADDAIEYSSEEMYNRYEEDYKKAFEEFYYSSKNGFYASSEYVFCLCDEDYVYCSLNFGKTDDSAVGNIKHYYWYGETEAGDYVNRCTVIHSNDVKKTVEMLKAELGDLSNPFNGGLVSPDSLHDSLMSEKRSDIISNLISMGVISVIMSLCMYFIMKSALMNRIREIGTYRAIGVSKANIKFRFLIESSVLTTLTVFIAFIIVSAALFFINGLSPVFESLLYYPVWMSAILIVLLYVLCLFCGTAPVSQLLRKTPSEIIAKYDI